MLGIIIRVTSQHRSIAPMIRAVSAISANTQDRPHTIQAAVGGSQQSSAAGDYYNSRCGARRSSSLCIRCGGDMGGLLRYRHTYGYTLLVSGLEFARAGRRGSVQGQMKEAASLSMSCRVRERWASTMHLMIAGGRCRRHSSVYIIYEALRFTCASPAGGICQRLVGMSGAGPVGVESSQGTNWNGIRDGVGISPISDRDTSRLSDGAEGRMSLVELLLHKTVIDLRAGLFTGSTVNNSSINPFGHGTHELRIFLGIIDALNDHNPMPCHPFIFSGSLGGNIDILRAH
ncbi:hypothetical protein B0H17DRAFT_1137024 [Mycena rosella]|uniref:Uncharacterized protein n=1 Tax=Mycena rosella TaxID=1033263 RepID=A0AAD7GDW6_MYCRO|nr:hypothetical protein B0H17DRAFT_1137024 [Mycena rosella]